MSNKKMLYVYWKILGVFPFDLTANGIVRFSYWGTIYSTILAVSYGLCYARAITGRMSFALPRASTMAVIANLAGLSAESAVLMWAWLYFGHRLKDIRRMLVRLKNIDESFAEYGIPTDDSTFFKEVKFHAVLVNVTWVLICSCSCRLMMHFDTSKFAVWMVLNIARIVGHSIVLMFFNLMRLIKERFRLLNESLRHLPNERAKGLGIRGEILKNSTLGAFKTAEKLEIYGRIHADLVDLTTIVVEFFSFSILLALLSECIQAASGLYTLCLVTEGATPNLVPITWTLWFAMYLIEIVILIVICDSTDKEANDTPNVLHSILVTGNADEYVESAQVLSLRLLQKQLRIELFGLFRMQLDAIHRITSGLGFYITIMLQLDNQNVAETH